MKTPPCGPAPLVLSLLLAPLAGCVEPRAIAPVLGAQREALARIKAAYADDIALLAEQTSANLDARETLLRGTLHRELIARGYITPSLDPDPSAFEHDLADAAFNGPLVVEVRRGRLTRETALDFINDYALALKMRREGADLRPRMLARLAPLASLADQRRAIEGGLGAHARDVSRLLDDAGAANEAVDVFSRKAGLENDPILGSDAPLWREILKKLKVAPNVGAAETAERGNP